jgi:O-antigen/teichoic acid export membrane protein
MLARAAHWLSVNADIFLIGRIYATDLLGGYIVARDISSLPHSKVGAILNQVALASFSQIQHDDVQVRHYLERGIRMMALMALPAFWGISALVPEAIEVLFGEQWLPAVDLVRVLSLVVPLRMLFNLYNQVVLARGQARLMLGITLVFTCMVVSSIAIGSFWSVFGVCVALAAGTVAAMLILRTYSRDHRRAALGQSAVRRLRLA